MEPRTAAFFPVIAQAAPTPNIKARGELPKPAPAAGDGSLSSWRHDRSPLSPARTRGRFVGTMNRVDNSGSCGRRGRQRSPAVAPKRLAAAA